jgi:serine/threonine-protein kinase
MHMPTATAEAAEALKRGMARHPDDRTPSAGQFARELATALDDGDVSAAPTRAMRPQRPVAVERRVPRPRAVAAAPPVEPRREPRAPARPPARRRPAPPDRPVAAAPEPRTTVSRRRPTALIPAVLLVLAAAAATAAVLLSTGADPQGAARSPRQDAKGGSSSGRSDESKAAPKRSRPAKPKQRTTPAAPAPPVSEPAPVEPTSAVDPARGAQLNDQGYALMQRGEYDEAIPILQQAVASWPEDSADLNYAYALFNLGKSLNRAGRPAEAIPYLEKRLNWDDQRDTVQAELDLARASAAQG